MLVALLNVVLFLLQILSYVIIAQAILSLLVAFNVINTHNEFMRQFLRALDTITEPLYRPIRKILPDFGGLDFSPFVVLIAIYILRMLLQGLQVDMISAYA